MANLKEILSIIRNVSNELGTSAYICGGTPRDKVLGNLSNIDDIDITTGNNIIHILAPKVASNIFGSRLNQLKDHYQLFVDGIKVDFSSNYILPNLLSILQRSGLKNPSNMQLELYSRDFTCNSLLMTLDLKKVIDPIGLGLNDIKKKRLRTCMPANITLGNDPKRIVRVIYLAAKLGFSLDNEIIEWVRKNPGLFIQPNQGYVVEKLNEAFKYNPQISKKIISELGLWNYIPSSIRGII